jgi:hypothetical protein
MINTTKKLLLTLSLIVAVVLMGLTSWGPLTPLKLLAGNTTISGNGSTLVNSPNLFKFTENTSYTQDGVTVTYNAEYQTIKLNGIATQNTTFTLAINPVLASGLYYFKMYPVSGTTSALSKTTLAPGNATSDSNYNSFSGYINNNLSNSANITTITRLKISPQSAVEYSDYVFKFSIKKDTAVTEWIHPNYTYYKSNISLPSNYSGDMNDIIYQYSAINDTFGDLSSQFEIIDSSSKYSAILASKYGYTPSSVVNQYGSNSLNIIVTSLITLNNTYVDQQFNNFNLVSLVNSIHDNLVIGNTYKLLLSITDNSLSFTYIEVSVLITDGEGPSIAGDSNINTGYSDFINLNTWLDSLSITDYSGVVSRSIILDTYSTNKQIIGNYTVTVRATDSLGNSTDKSFTFNVIDNISPNIIGPDTFIKPLTSTLTVNDIKKLYSANDYIDGNVNSRIEIIADGYSGMGHIENIYEIVFRVTDLSGNFATKNVMITVNSDIPSVNYVADGLYVNVNTGFILSIEDVKDILVSSGKLIMYSDTNYNVLINEYIGNESNPGSYSISIRFSQTSGITETHSIIVLVNDPSSLPDGSFNPPAGDFPWVPIIIVSVVVIGLFLYKRKH